MKPTVYIETTIPSYFADSRPSLAADIARTREWWDQERSGYECFTSAAVLDEIMSGDYASKAACIELVKDLPLLAVNDRIIEIAEVYQANQVMPSPPVRDALHVAIATYYRMDYLWTWNCRHLANANKARHLEVVNARMGLATPRLVTPQVLRPEI